VWVSFHIPTIINLKFASPCTIKFINAPQVGDIYSYKNIKQKLHKIIAAIWFDMQRQGIEAELYQHNNNWKQQAVQQHHESSSTIPSTHNWPDHDQQHRYRHAPTVKPEATTAVVELLMMGVRTPKTCWAIHNHQVINLRNCCI
jgi:hypothetical protein